MVSVLSIVNGVVWAGIMSLLDPGKPGLSAATFVVVTLASVVFLDSRQYQKDQHDRDRWPDL